MRQPVKYVVGIWAVAAVLASWFARDPAIGWAVTAPFVLVGPGIVAARYVSPDDRRPRWPVAVLASFAAVGLVSEVFTLAGRFSGPAVVTSLALGTVFAMSRCPAPSDRLPVLPRREVVHHPASTSVERFLGRRRTAPAPGAPAATAVAEPAVGAPAAVAVLPDGAPPVPASSARSFDDWVSVLADEDRELALLASSPSLATPRSAHA